VNSGNYLCNPSDQTELYSALLLSLLLLYHLSPFLSSPRLLLLPSSSFVVLIRHINGPPSQSIPRSYPIPSSASRRYCVIRRYDDVLSSSRMSTKHWEEIKKMEIRTKGQKTKKKKKKKKSSQIPHSFLSIYIDL
jgi:hypothetical protein